MEILTNKDEYPIILTEKAIEMVKQAIEEDMDLHGSSLRVASVGGGCSGLQYALDFDKEAKEMDYVMEFNGLKVFLDMVSATNLEGCVIDYVVQGMQAGFKFNNPIAKTCGCGSSFSV